MWSKSMYSHALPQAQAQHFSPSMDINTNETTALPSAALTDAETKKQLSDAVDFLRESASHLEVYQFAASRGHSLAKQWLQQFYLRSQFCANQGNATGQHYLGLCYGFGISVAQDLKKAFDQYTLAANQKHGLAQCALGRCYEHGQGVAKDPKKAFEQYTLAANQKYARAQFALGRCYEHGIGVAIDLKNAIALFMLAAKQNYAGQTLASAILSTISIGCKPKKRACTVLSWPLL